MSPMTTSFRVPGQVSQELQNGLGMPLLLPPVRELTYFNCLRVFVSICLLSAG